MPAKKITDKGGFRLKCVQYRLIFKQKRGLFTGLKKNKIVGAFLGTLQLAHTFIILDEMMIGIGTTRHLQLELYGAQGDS